jgi:3-hydroxyisobutyrate dehydrogenase
MKNLTHGFRAISACVSLFDRSIVIGSPKLKSIRPLLSRLHPEVGEHLVDATGVGDHSGRDHTLGLVSDDFFDAVKAFAELAAQHGNTFVDAPVSGGTSGAAAGTLTFMVGGGPNVYEQVKPVLSAMGKNIIHCGDTGTGQIAKICNNLVLGVTMAAVAEAMSLGAALGVDPKLLGALINTSTGRCWSSDTCNPFPGVIETAPASRSYTGGFAIDLMLKDLGLATDAAKLARQPVYLGALAQQLYQAMSTKGAGRLDFSSVIKLYVRSGQSFSFFADHTGRRSAH